MRVVITALVTFLIAPAAVRAEPVAYRSALWLETSSGVQRLSVTGVLAAWERQAEAGASAGGAANLQGCLVRRGYTVDALRERLTRFAVDNPGRTFPSLTSFIFQGLRDLCPEPRS